MEKRFATLSIPGQSEKTLSRALSFSELSTSRRIFFQQLEDSNGLLRQYSCEQIFDKDTNLRRVNISTTISTPNSVSTWRPSAPRFDSLKNTGWHKSLPKSTTKKFKSKEDKSNPIFKLDGLKISDESSPEIQDFSSLNINPNQRDKSLENRKEIVKMEAQKIEDESSNNLETEKGITKFFFFALIAIAAIIMSTLLVDLTQEPFDFTNSSLELREKVFGQYEAIESIIEHFQKNLEHLSVLTIVGGTGVGKTFTANIIKKNFPYKSNIFEYTAPLVGRFDKTFDSLSILHCNLIILDNLKNQDVPDFVEFVEFMQKKKETPCAMILAILNPQETDNRLVKSMNLNESVKELHRIFAESKVKSRIVSYRPLDVETLDKCIKKEATAADIFLSDKQFQQVRSHLLSTNSGCKGAQAKVNLIVNKSTVL